MIHYENHLGTIDISHECFVNLVGSTVVNCFGVAGMATTTAQKGFSGWFRKRNAPDRGIRVRLAGEETLVIDLHILVLYGTNIAAIVKSIMNKVTYYVEEITGFQVARVNVFIDGMKNE